MVLNRPGHSDLKRVTFEGFLLLKEAESSFGTSIQSIERIRAWYTATLDEPHLSALSGRMMRQENPAASIDIELVILGGDLQSAQAFSILLQADWVRVGMLEVSEAIGEEGWRILAKAIHPGIHLESIRVSREGLAQCKKEDIKHIWDSGCWFRIFKTLEDLHAGNWRQASLVGGQEDWSRMERVLDMSEQEFSEDTERRIGGV